MAEPGLQAPDAPGPQPPPTLQDSQLPAQPAHNPSMDSI